MIDLDNLNDDQFLDLTELVHNQAAELASNAINAGESVDWLILNGWTKQDIIDRLKEMGQ